MRLGDRGWVPWKVQWLVRHRVGCEAGGQVLQLILGWLGEERVDGVLEGMEGVHGVTTWSGRPDRNPYVVGCADR